MTTANQTRRNVMTTAWVIFREGRQIRDGRTFAQCLGWAWTHVKREAARVAFAGMRVVHFSSSLIRSPIGRTFAGWHHGRVADFKAAYTTASVGA